ncbi:MAG: hypothetical protein QXL15_00790 [Candidatus Korarchaeota archaeon]
MEDIFWVSKDNVLECRSCSNYCKFSQESTVGYCGNITRKGNVLEESEIPLALGPEYIEKLELYHFWPGSTFYVVHGVKGPAPENMRYFVTLLKHPKITTLSIKEIVKIAKQGKMRGLAVINPESSISWVLSAIKEFSKNKMQTCVISYGYLTKDAVKMMVTYGLNALLTMHIPSSESSSEETWNAVKLAKESGIHVENAVLLIKNLNDSDAFVHEFSKRHLNILGNDVPLHFIPDIAKKPSTDTLERCVKIGKVHGIKYVYLSYPGHKYANTMCPSCNRVKIERYDTVTGYDLENNVCSCREPIPIIGDITVHKREFRKRAL